MTDNSLTSNHKKNALPYELPSEQSSLFDKFPEEKNDSKNRSLILSIQVGQNGKRIVPRCHVASGRERFEGDRFHESQMRRFIEESMQSGYLFMGVDKYFGFPTITQGSLMPRWSPEYQKRSFARIYKFAEACENLPFCNLGENGYTVFKSTDRVFFVTLTVGHSRTGSYRSMSKQVDDLRLLWSKVSRYVRRKHWRFLRVMEYGEEHGFHIHFHMIIVDADLSDVEEFVNKWVSLAGENGIKCSRRAQNIKRPEVNQITNVGAYLTKYVEKNFKSAADNLEWLHWMELAYRKRIRVFAMDKRSSAYIRYRYPDNHDLTACGEVAVYHPGADEYQECLFDDVFERWKHRHEVADDEEVTEADAWEDWYDDEGGRVPYSQAPQTAPSYERGIGGASPP